MIKKYLYEGDDIVADIRDTYGFEGDLARIYATTKDQEAHKWHHYIPLYDRYFSRFRGTRVRMLEIGVAKGGSLQMWRRYLGEEATLFGVDIRKKCAAFDGDYAQVRIGSQDDPEFLAKVIDEMGGVDIVLDDGSHKMPHLEASLKALYPRLSMGGLYVIEDLHTCYWPGYEGGFDKPENFFNRVRGMIDDMHQRYHHREFHLPEMDGALTGMHVHDSLLVIEKGLAPILKHSKVA